ncbi:MAG: hypothetical protein JRH20_06165 [Deltaproteobacteria bacterium]|nr:hypothetical protein [Deltaproteobacteria bacterium]
MRRLISIALITLLPMACTDTGDDENLDDAGVAKRCTTTEGDYDKDGISDGIEGCKLGYDSDGDGLPDWQDLDSDDDGRPDEIEAGEPGECIRGPETWPCDSDSDGLPDHVDIDADGDGVLDGDEDHNGDGLLGCCIIRCAEPDDRNQRDDCMLNEDGCGPGQSCEQGICSPGRSFDCSNGETDPRLKDTFTDGKLDGERGSFICRDATEDRPQGRKLLQLRRSTDPSQDPRSGDWHIALEPKALYSTISFEGVAKEAVGTIDHSDPQQEVAGFVVSLPSAATDVQGELSHLLAKLSSSPPGGDGALLVRSSGTQAKTHDRYDAVFGTFLDLQLTRSADLSRVRNELIAGLLDRSMGDFANLPGPYGGSHSDYIIRLVTLRRFVFERTSGGQLMLDADGYPAEDLLRPEGRRVIVMGAIAARANYEAPTRQTGFIADDLANGTAVATHSDTVDDECDVGTISDRPIADIIWVMDESGSMDDVRRNVVNNAQNFFSRAIASGLDFRMGVTNVLNPNLAANKPLVGKFCSVASPIPNHDGGADRFLLPGEQDIFGSCILNPPGYEGGAEYGLVNAYESVVRHLPRSTDQLERIRNKASTVIIVVTDEAPQELESIIGSATKTCNLSATQQLGVNNALEEYLDLFKGVSNTEGKAIMHLIGYLCGSKCPAQDEQKAVGHGYMELARALGGQIGDVCQQDLGSTLQAIIDSVVGAASPVKLEYVPIAASLAVAVDGTAFDRSRTRGFDYRAENNSIVFINVPFDKGSEVVASYKRWARQVLIE